MSIYPFWAPVPVPPAARIAEVRWALGLVATDTAQDALIAEVLADVAEDCASLSEAQQRAVAVQRLCDSLGSAKRGT